MYGVVHYPCHSQHSRKLAMYAREGAGNVRHATNCVDMMVWIRHDGVDAK